MAWDAKELIAERLKLNDDCNAMLDRAEAERRGLDDAEQARFDKMQKRIAELLRAVDNRAKVDQEERWLSESRGRKTDSEVFAGAWAGPSTQREPWALDARRSDADLAFRAWACGSRASKEMLQAAQRIGFSHHAPELDLRALSVGTTDAGGYSVPDEMMRAFWQKQKWFGRVRNNATVFQVATGGPLPIPVTDDTGNVGEILAEGAAVTTTADPVFSQIVLSPKKYSSKGVVVSAELLTDSFINLPEYLGGILGERIARIQNQHYTVGTGVGQPIGVITAASVGKTATATNAVTFDEVLDLIHSVDVAYRDRPNSRLMMHDVTASYLRKLKDSQNRYLWEVATQEGQADRLFGIPVVINSDMSSTFATNNRLIAYGDFAAYHIAEVVGPQILRSDDVRILYHQSVFLAFARSDGALADSGAVKVLRTA